MGEVYRARDVRLGRDIALKVLPPHLADDESRGRFEQEARSASALSHPNIVTIHDVGEADGVPVSRDGVHRRAHAARDGGRRRAGVEGAAADRSAGRRRAGGRARKRHRPPRPEAGKHPGHRRRRREGARLRPREGGVGDRCRAHRRGDAGYTGGRRPRHGRLHVARTGTRRADRLPHGSILVRRHPLRARHRPTRVRARVDGRDGVGRHHRRSGSDRSSVSPGFRRRSSGRSSAASRSSRRTATAPRAISIGTLSPFTSTSPTCAPRVTRWPRPICPRSAPRSSDATPKWARSSSSLRETTCGG